MFFILSKLFAFIISPISWVVTLVIFTLFVKDPKRAKKILFTSFILLFFFSNQMVFNDFMHSWEVPAEWIVNVDTCDVGVVLGGMISYDNLHNRVQFFRGTDRLLQAVELYRKKKIRKILFTGGSGSVLHQENREAVFAKRFFPSLFSVMIRKMKVR